MRLLGIDYGSKRIGIALSDDGGEFAIPVIVIENTKNNIKEIVDLANKNLVKEIVIGESKNYKGEDNAIMEKSLELKNKLEEKGFKVYMEPEFMTSMNAERFQGKNDMLDASAAALILQSYLDRRKNK